MNNSNKFVAKVYQNRFAEMESVPEGGWVVINRVTGLAVCDGDPNDSDASAKIFPTYAAAREVMVNIYNRYRAME